MADSTLSPTPRLSSAINISGHKKNVLIEGSSRSCGTARMKIKITLTCLSNHPPHTHTHTNTRTRAHSPCILNHEWDSYTPRQRAESGKKAASLITCAGTSLDLKTPALSVFAGSSCGCERLQSSQIHFLVVLQLRIAVGKCEIST